MNISDLLSQGINLMLLGMGMVFFILGLLIVVIKAASHFILKYEPEPAVPALKSIRFNNINEDVVAAITVAVERFRAK